MFVDGSYKVPSKQKLQTLDDSWKFFEKYLNTFLILLLLTNWNICWNRMKGTCSWILFFQITVFVFFYLILVLKLKILLKFDLYYLYFILWSMEAMNYKYSKYNRFWFGFEITLHMYLPIINTYVCILWGKLTRVKSS